MGNNSSWCTLHRETWSFWPENGTFCTDQPGQCGRIVNESMYCLADNDCCPAGVSGLRHLLILSLVWIPVVTLFGNTLVILAVAKFKNLQTPTNHYIVSLAVADISLAVLVMPVQIFVEMHSGKWTLSPYFCDAFVMFDVWFCTASIFNLVAISFDRHKAVTKPLDYASQRSLTWIYVKIAFSWLASFAIAVPLGGGYNWTPGRVKEPFACYFFNSDFLFYSSVGSFYLPTVLMIILYARVFNTLRIRANQKMKKKQSDNPNVAGSNGALYLNCDAHLSMEDLSSSASPRLQDTQKTLAVQYNAATETTYTVVSSDVQSDSFVGRGRREDSKGRRNSSPAAESSTSSSKVQQSFASDQQHPQHLCDHEINASGDDVTYVTANRSATGAQSDLALHADPHTSARIFVLANGQSRGGCPTATSAPPDGNHLGQADAAEGNGKPGSKDAKDLPGADVQPTDDEMQFSDWQEFRRHLKRRVRIAKRGGSLADKPSRATARQAERAKERKKNDGGEYTPLCTNFGHIALPRIRRKQKKAKKERSAVRREQKATQTLAIVLGVFLLSWTPFFTVNIINAVCLKFPSWKENGLFLCNIPEILYSLFVWLGYVNSCLNPIIYTIFNADFRKAFKELLKRK